MPELRKVYKQGNSLVIAVPASYAVQAQLVAGDYVSFAITPSGELLLKPATRSGPIFTGNLDLPGQFILPISPAEPEIKKSSAQTVKNNISKNTKK